MTVCPLFFLQERKGILKEKEGLKLQFQLESVWNFFSLLEVFVLQKRI